MCVSSFLTGFSWLGILAYLWKAFIRHYSRTSSAPNFQHEGAVLCCDSWFPSRWWLATQNGIITQILWWISFIFYCFDNPSIEYNFGTTGPGTVPVEFAAKYTKDHALQWNWKLKMSHVQLQTDFPRSHHIYDLAQSVGSRKHWLWDIARKRN